MPRLLFGNFDFEHQLAGSAAPQPGSRLHRINLELTPALIALADADDCLWFPADCDMAFLDRLTVAGLSPPKLVDAADSCPLGLSLHPWGWSPEMKRWGDRLGCLSNHPPLESVKRANCRLFALQRESEWNCGLEGAVAVDELDQLAAVIKKSTRQFPNWVLKARYGMSGRERHLGQSPELDPQTAAWARKRINRDGTVIFEPWVERLAETGLQWEIPQTGEPQLLGITPLLTDHAGHYRGNRFTISGAESATWQRAVEVTRRLAGQLQAQGYFGPLGVDALRYRDQRGAEQIRPLQDINARYTMGRLALGFQRCLSAGEVGTWLHVSQAQTGGSIDDFLTQKRGQLPTGCRLLPTSPAAINGQPPHLAHLLVTATSEWELAIAERAFLT